MKVSIIGEMIAMRFAVLLGSVPTFNAPVSLCDPVINVVQRFCASQIDSLCQGLSGHSTRAALAADFIIAMSNIRIRPPLAS